MSLQFGALVSCLFKPKETFEKIKAETTMKDGLMIAAILVILSTIITTAVTMASPAGMYVNIVAVVVSSIVNIVLALLFSVIVIGWLASKIATAIGNGSADPDTTMGFMGYAYILAFISSVLMTLLIFAGISGASSVAGAVQGAMSAGIIAIVLGVVFFFWSLWVGGQAVATANNTSLGAGIAGYFLAYIAFAIIMAIIAIILVLVFAAIGLTFAGLSSGIPTMF